MTAATPGREEIALIICPAKGLDYSDNPKLTAIIEESYQDALLKADKILARLAAKLADEPDIFGIAVHALTVGAPGIGPTIRDGIARSISMRVKAITTGEPKP
jgi:hypothetical protein